MTESQDAAHSPGESQSQNIASKLNWLRAGVMGANDGIVSTAGLVVGVASAAVSSNALLISGVAALASGAISMGVGEYIAVASQRDTQRAELAREKAELAADPEQELEQLAELIEARGVEPKLAHEVAVQLSEKDPLTAHARLELGIDPSELANPWAAGLASMLAFLVGGSIPFSAIILSPREDAVAITAVAVVIALAINGFVSAHLGGASKRRAMARTVGGGVLAMAITSTVGSLVGAGK